MARTRRGLASPRKHQHVPSVLSADQATRFVQLGPAPARAAGPGGPAAPGASAAAGATATAGPPGGAGGDDPLVAAAVEPVTARWPRSSTPPGSGWPS